MVGRKSHGGTQSFEAVRRLNPHSVDKNVVLDPISVFSDLASANGKKEERHEATVER